MPVTNIFAKFSQQKSLTVSGFWMFFALPISAALGFKIFSNWPRVKSLPNPVLGDRRNVSTK